MRRFIVMYLSLIVVVCFSTIGFPDSKDQLLYRKISFTTTPQTPSVPVINGKLDDNCWEQATKLSNFLLTAGDNGKPATYQTECYLIYDDTHLYVAFKCEEPDIDGIKTTSVMWDDQDILYDDRVEIFLDVNHDHRSYYELAVNPAGVQFDQKGFNRFHGSKTCDMYPDWNCFWRAKTSVGENEWIAEIAVDVTSLGIDKIEQGMTWGLNLARVRQPEIDKGEEFFKRKPQGSAEYSAWVPVEDYIRESISNFHAPIEFGDLVFGDPGFEVKSFSFRSALYAFGPVGYPSYFGKNPIEISLKPKKLSEAILKITVEPSSVEKWSSTEEITFNSEQKINTHYYIPEDQENKIIIQILDSETQNQLYRTSYTEVTMPFIEFNLEPLYTRNPKKVEPVKFRTMTDQQTRAGATLELSFYDMDTDEKITTVVKTDLSQTEKFSPVFEVSKLRKLPGGNYYIDCKLLDKKDNEILAKFRQNLTKFDNDLPEKFHAVEGPYNYGGITDHSIRIRYPFSAEFVFWRKASYIPWWDMEQAAMTNEFVECWGGGNQGCNEPMQDRQCRYSRVELIENSDARVVVHWRYALSDPHYRIYRNEWVDEYYVLYPDGIGVREVNLWPNSDTRHEMFEALLAKPPAVQTEQLFDDKFATISNLAGEGNSNKYYYDNRDDYRALLNSSTDFIVKIFFKDRMVPFASFSLREDLMPGVTPDHITICSRIISRADRRGHWPASRYQIDGYNTVGLDVPHHGNIGNVQSKVDQDNQPTTWNFLIGVSEKNSDKPEKYTKSWLYPAKLKMLNKHFVNEGFDFSQRAYIINKAGAGNECRLELDTEHNSVLNPIFLFKNAKTRVEKVKVDNNLLSDSLVRIGEGKEGLLILFLNTEIGDGQTLTICFD